ncbi:MAG: hypothetical protein LBK52_03580, partial [Deltaproteobacteria bacterium]|nr:hypothetical protein [Deltaproteobacteria bacterium]
MLNSNRPPAQVDPKSKFIFRIFVAGSLVILLLSLAARFKFAEHLASEEKELLAHLSLASRLAAAEVTGEELNRWQQKEDAQRPAYRAFKERLEKLAESLDVVFVYYFRVTGGKIQYIADSDANPRTAVGIDSEPVDFILEAGFEPALEGEAVTPGRQVHSADWPNLISAYTPVFDSSGRVAAVAGADADDTRLRHASLILTLLTLAQILSAGVLVFCGFFFRSWYVREVQQVRKADKAKSLFLARMSHEIRT